ncbi:MAG: zinc ABC transporter substrate-binding protein [Chitinivibrionia bacterium]|nr:zinc ABC transporter substrate-binding protein [Chitinivibrionia bacterium]
MRKIIFYLFIFCACVFAKKNVEPTTVITSIPALEALTKEIVKGTPISVVNPFGNEISLDELEGICKEFEKELDKLSPNVAAVIDIRSIIPQDQLFIQIRHRNIRVIEIDCATPASPVITAIGKIRDESGEVNVFAWLSLSNAIRMAEILESDLSALFPKHAKKISENLILFKKNANAMRNDFVRKFLKSENFSAICFTQDFDYLLKDIDMFVVEKFSPEYDWDEETIEKFENLLKDGQISTIISRWETGEPAAAIMKKYDVKSSVLETGFPAANSFNDGFLKFWERNVLILLNSLK